MYFYVAVEEKYATSTGLNRKAISPTFDIECFHLRLLWCVNASKHCSKRVGAGQISLPPSSRPVCATGFFTFHFEVVELVVVVLVVDASETFCV